MVTDKSGLYLCALLQHIKTDTAQNIFNDYAEDGFSTYLALSDRYALTEKVEIREDSFFPFLASPFDFLNDREKPTEWKIEAQELGLSNSWFPKKETGSEQKNMQACWQSFDQELARVTTNVKAEVLAKSVENLLLKYASSIPNPSNINQEVSWYDYARIKAGLAVCLWEFTSGAADPQIDNEDTPLRIIRADLSGIQSFIYDIASKQASKNLKGRSFYVQLLSDAVMRLLLESLGLFSGNVMYASGGNFFIIAPNTEAVVGKLGEVEKLISRKLFETHQGRIAVVIGHKEVSQEKILKGKINEAIKELFEEELDRKKKQKFASYIADNYSEFFKPIDQGGDIFTDAITGEEINAKEEPFYEVLEDSVLPKYRHKGWNPNTNDTPSLLKISTGKQIFLGHKLKNAVCILVGKGFPDKENTIHPCDLGVTYKVLEEDDLSSTSLDVLQVDEILVLDEEKISTSFKEHGQLVSFFYGGYQSPILSEEDIEKLQESADDQNRKVGDVKQFHELALGEGTFKRLAVLRMDLDGLGSLFKDLAFPTLSFSYYAALSRSLDWFFRGYLNTIWSANEDFRKFSQIIYSGGDDLFIVGRWDVMIHFAETIKTEFAAYTCQTGYPTISGGIAIVTDKFPIMKAADFAAGAEKEAKQHKLVHEEDGFEKNSINILGMSLHWETEYKLVKQLKNELVLHITERDKLSKSFLGKIRMHHNLMKQFEKDRKKKLRSNPRWIWLTAYDLSRFIKQQKASAKDFVKRVKDDLAEADKQYLSEKIAFLEKVKNAVFSNRYIDENDEETYVNSQYHFLELLNLAARWAELVNRSK